MNRDALRSMLAVACCASVLPARFAPAQVPPPPTPPPPKVLEEVSFVQKLGDELPLDLVFRDEEGREVELRRLFDQKPVVLALVYYRCPMLCDMVLNGMLRAFRTIGIDIGDDFDVVTVSFDPRETPELAAKKKASYTEKYGRPGGERGWRFLTGEEPAIRALADACGFRYHYDARSDQYAHASGILVVTPEGRLSRYLYGLEYSPRDLRLGLVEASSNRIGSLVDQVLLLCYQYDPASGKYGFAIMASLRIAAVATLVVIAGFIGVSIRRERRAERKRREDASGPEMRGS